MKNLSIYALSTLMALYSLHPLLVLGVFEWNRAYLAKELCVQRVIEDNDCQAQCQLQAALEREAQQAAMQSRWLEQIDVPLFCTTSSDALLNTRDFELLAAFQGYAPLFFSFQEHLLDIFHPPIQA
ncbi:hypothetical protein [Eisenibacter elegans]|jgi:hypothetical protein|uniref:hypothetical protein n=1 Tax=Eisenibacter elegans TaxID=997 RepID=UPI00047986C3|nr:hypothetical protein [Eisenibacter elegans]